MRQSCLPWIKLAPGHRTCPFNSADQKYTQFPGPGAICLSNFRKLVFALLSNSTWNKVEPYSSSDTFNHLKFIFSGLPLHVIALNRNFIFARKNFSSDSITLYLDKCTFIFFPKKYSKQPYIYIYIYIYIYKMTPKNWCFNFSLYIKKYFGSACEFRCILNPKLIIRR